MTVNYMRYCFTKKPLRAVHHYVIAFGFFLTLLGIYQLTKTTHQKIDWKRDDQTNFRKTPLPLLGTRQAAHRLLDIQRNFERAFRRQAPPSLADVIALKRIVTELYPSINISSVLDESTSQPDLNSKTLMQGPFAKNRVVCPDKYDQKAMRWHPTTCTVATPISRLVTVVVNVCHHNESKVVIVEKLLHDFSVAYPGMQVVVTCAKNANNEEIGDWSAAFDLVKTPLTLVARDVHGFSNHSSPLDRMVRVLTETPGVAVVGGAVRNSSRHWKVGCFQTKLSNYVLRYSKGYHHSHSECMFCDYVDGPFLSYTNLLQDSFLDKSASVSAMEFQEFFLHMNLDYLTMSCPDVMFYADASMAGGAEVLKKNTWLPLAKKLQLNRVLIEYELSHVLHRFTCKDADIDCTIKSDSTYSYALPVCCREEMANALEIWIEFCRKHQINYTASSGTLLSAVKLVDVAPWDYNSDLLFANDNFTFLKSSLSEFKSKGMALNDFRDPTCCDDLVRDHLTVPKFKMWTPDLIIFLEGFRDFDNDSCYVYEMDREKLTLVEVHGVWINSTHNPGFCSRSRYGHEILKHSQNWQDLGMKSVKSQYKSGVFEPCVDQSRHDCLDRHPGDGSFGFLVPEW